MTDSTTLEGLVAREASEADRRVAYARLTDAGLQRLRAAQRSHRRDIQTLFAQHFETDELDTLDSLLARLPGAGGEGDWAG